MPAPGQFAARPTTKFSRRAVGGMRKRVASPGRCGKPKYCCTMSDVGPGPVNADVIDSLIRAAAAGAGRHQRGSHARHGAAAHFAWPIASPVVAGPRSAPWEPRGDSRLPGPRRAAVPGARPRDGRHSSRRERWTSRISREVGVGALVLVGFALFAWPVLVQRQDHRCARRLRRRRLCQRPGPEGRRPGARLGREKGRVAKAAGPGGKVTVTLELSNDVRPHMNAGPRFRRWTSSAPSWWITPPAPRTHPSCRRAA